MRALAEPPEAIVAGYPAWLSRVAVEGTAAAAGAAAGAAGDGCVVVSVGVQCV